MRRLVVSMNITLDGFLSGPDGELDWHFGYWTADMGELLQERLADADTILLGRRTYEAMSAYWGSAHTESSLSRDDLSFATLMYQYRKLVCSASLQRADWHNSGLLRGNVPAGIRKLKQEPGKNIMLYGSATLLRSLAAASLVDEYLLWLHPVLLGRGNPLFGKQTFPASLRLLEARTCSSGVSLLHYRVQGSGPQ